MVKACFDLKNSNIVSLSEEQIECTGDQYYPDDDEKLGSLHYASDFAHYKPNADLSLVGHCYVPDGRSATVCPVQFQLNDKVAELTVLGDRYWSKGLTGMSMTVPDAFETMPLRYENSFGGSDHSENPTGKGAHAIEDDLGNVLWPLPNIELPADLIVSKDQVTNPAGFGPLNSEWSYRKSKLGTYDESWLENKWPWFPDDFESSYYNAAPKLMQFNGYFKGDESLQFTHMHPNYAIYKTQLAALTVRCFARTISQNDLKEKSFQEIDMNLDTLHVDMDAEKVVLVWRGWMPVESEEMKDISDILVCSESMHKPAMSVDSYYDILKKCQTEQERDFEEESVQPVVFEKEAESPSETPKIQALIEKANADGRAALVEAGIDPDNLPPPSDEEKELIAKLLINAAPAGDNPPRSLADLITVIAANDNLSIIDLSCLNVESIDFTGLNLQGADFSERNLNGACFINANLTGVIFCKASLSNADFRGAILNGADFTGALVTEADFQQAEMEQAIFESCDARAANFNKIKAPGVDFSKSKLQGASFIGAKIPSASFNNSDLNHVSMRNATLTNACLHGASALATMFIDADLTGVRASEKNIFNLAVFSGAKMNGANLSGASCVKTNFSYCDMHDVNLIEADLTEANMSFADLRQAKLTRSCLKNTNMTKVNLYEASLEKAVLRDTLLLGANLYGAELLDADVESVDFSQTNLKMTKLDGTY